jgi:hypothetical protein
VQTPKQRPLEFGQRSSGIVDLFGPSSACSTKLFDQPDHSFELGMLRVATDLVQRYPKHQKRKGHESYADEEASEWGTYQTQTW